MLVRNSCSRCNSECRSCPTWARPRPPPPYSGCNRLHYRGVHGLGAAPPGQCDQPGLDLAGHLRRDRRRETLLTLDRRDDITATLGIHPGHIGDRLALITAVGVREALLAAAWAELEEHGHAGISLRAVARRAGVSHAAPKYHFPDRAALLTAIAVEGFTALTAALRTVTQAEPGRRPADPLAALGHAYIDFGLTNPALFDLMFRPSELHADDPALCTAQQEAITELDTAVRRLSSTPPEPGRPAPLTLVSWALVHGLVVLTRDGALRSGTPAAADPAAVAQGLADLFRAHLTI